MGVPCRDGNRHASENKPSSVEAILNYIVRSSEKPVVYAYEPPPGIPPTIGQSEPHSVQISNARLEPIYHSIGKGFSSLRTRPQCTILRSSAGGKDLLPGS